MGSSAFECLSSVHMVRRLDEVFILQESTFCNENTSLVLQIFLHLQFLIAYSTLDVCIYRMPGYVPSSKCLSYLSITEMYEVLARETPTNPHSVSMHTRP